MPAVPFSSEEIADEKRETTGELSLLTAEPIGIPTISAKPEAIVRPLRRREPSDDENNKPPDLQDLEAQIIDKLTKFDKSQKPQKSESIRDLEKRPPYRLNLSRDSKKGSRDVSDPKNSFVIDDLYTCMKMEKSIAKNTVSCLSIVNSMEVRQIDQLGVIKPN